MRQRVHDDVDANGIAARGKQVMRLTILVELHRDTRQFRKSKRRTDEDRAQAGDQMRRLPMSRHHRAA